jgi:hypothetical protein
MSIVNESIAKIIKSCHLLIFTLLILLTLLPVQVTSIGCYKCSTMSGNHSACMDPFEPGKSNISFYDSDCYSGQPERVGLFPARFCLKVSGKRGE